MEIQEKYSISQMDYGYIYKNYMEKDQDCNNLHKSITRILRTYSEQ